MATVTIQKRKNKNDNSYVINYKDPRTGKKKYHKTFRKHRLAQKEANDLRALLDAGQKPKPKRKKLSALTFSEVAKSLRSLDVRNFPWLVKALRNGEFLLIDNISELPPEATSTKMMMERYNVDSLLLYPIYVRDILAGFIGFDNIPYGAHYKVPLTTVDIPAYHIGMRAAELVIGQIADPEKSRREKVLFDVSLIHRASA